MDVKKNLLVYHFVCNFVSSYCDVGGPSEKELEIGGSNQYSEGLSSKKRKEEPK